MPHYHVTLCEREILTDEVAFEIAAPAPEAAARLALGYVANEVPCNGRRAVAVPGQPMRWLEPDAVNHTEVTATIREKGGTGGVLGEFGASCFYPAMSHNTVALLLDVFGRAILDTNHPECHEACRVLSASLREMETS